MMMTTFLTYLLQVNLSLAICYLLYAGLLRRNTFFSWRRVTLLLMLATSVLMPLAALSGGITLSTDTYLIPTYYLSEIQIGRATHAGNFSLLQWGMIIYLIGVICMMLYTLTGMCMLLLHIRTCQKQKIGNTFVYVPQQVCAPFSFFKIICFSFGRLIIIAIDYNRMLV